MRLFLKYARERVCVVRSLKVALVVGTVLAFLNHYDSILSGMLNATVFFQIVITYAVPYSVATFGSAMQARHMELTQKQSKLGITNTADVETTIGTEDKG